MTEFDSKNSPVKKFDDDIDIKKVNRMWRKIYLVERNNLKTANLKDKEMRKKIEEIIEGEADKCF